MTIPTPPTDYVFHQGEALGLLHAARPADASSQTQLAAANAHAALAIAAAIDATIRTVRELYDPIPYAVTGDESGDTGADDHTEHCADGHTEPQSSACEPLAEWEEQFLKHQAHVDAQAALVRLSKWIDTGLADRDREARQMHRVIKVAEEAGEAVAALIGAWGANPRKGVTHTDSELIDELLDVAVTALGAIEHLTDHAGDSLELLDQHIAMVAERADRFTAQA
jgi:hypothetical protein